MIKKMTKTIIKKSRFFPLMSFCFLFSSCALLQPKPKVVYKTRYHNDPAMVSLNRIALRAEHSRELLADIQMEKAKSSVTLQGAHSAQRALASEPYGWGKRVSMSYQGPFDKAVIRLANQAHYLYYEEGVKPASVPLVTIDAQHQTLKEILNNISVQTPDSIAITVYPKTHTLVVRYRR